MQKVSTPRRRTLRTSAKNGKLKITSFSQIKDKGVRAMAEKIAGKDIHRVQILGPAEVIVHNHPNWRK